MEVMEVDENDFYHHSGSAQPSDSNSNSEDEESQEKRFESAQARYFGYDTQLLNSEGGARSRFMRTQSSEEEEEDAKEGEAVDPGPFRYNKRVFVTALPCLLLTLVMTGES